METKLITEPNANKLSESPSTEFVQYSLINFDKKQVETARKIIIERVHAFIQQIKNTGQPFKINKEGPLKLSFEVSEIEDCLSQMEQELCIVEREPLYYLEWNILVPLTDASHGHNFFGQYFNVSKLDLIEGLINHCFGSTVCFGSFQPTMMPIDNHVPGRVCIEKIHQIIEIHSEAVCHENIQPAVMSHDNSAPVLSEYEEKKNREPQFTAAPQNISERGNNNEKLLTIINKLKNNISMQQNGRQTIRNSEWKINLFVAIENRLKKEDPQYTDINQYVADIRDVCAMKRNLLHFWSEPHSVSEFALMVKELDLEQNPFTP
ncbi:hypothetical protein [Legionella sp. 227]|uniref:hypothetical protein n=1 Tax=Legionella sp. 227 TaxID=3367288 RepID=UPI00370D146B